VDTSWFQALSLVGHRTRREGREWHDTISRSEEIDETARLLGGRVINTSVLGLLPLKNTAAFARRKCPHRRWSASILIGRPLRSTFLPKTRRHSMATNDEECIELIRLSSKVSSIRRCWPRDLESQIYTTLLAEAAHEPGWSRHLGGRLGNTCCTISSNHFTLQHSKQ